MTAQWGPDEQWQPGKLDFSRAHFLDHRPFSRRCRQFPGGGWRHLHLSWRMGRRDQLLRPFAIRLLCPRGWHQDVMWQYGSRSSMVCSWCRRKRIPSEAELERYPRITFHPPEGP